MIRARTGILSLALVVLVLAALLLVAGCGEESPGTTGQRFIQLLSDRQFGQAYDMLATDSPARAIPGDQTGADPREEFIRLAEANFPEGLQFTDLKIVDEKIEGDRATVRWSAVTKIPDAPEEQTEQDLTLVKEDGEWKVWQ